MTDFNIDVTTTSPVPRFSLTGGGDEPYPCIALAVLDTADGMPIWFLFADPAHFEPRDPERFAKLANRAKRERLSVPEMAVWAREERGVGVREVVYGQVPMGFMQVEPGDGTPLELANDRRYAFLAIGAETMLVEFSVEAA